MLVFIRYLEKEYLIEDDEHSNNRNNCHRQATLHIHTQTHTNKHTHIIRDFRRLSIVLCSMCMEAKAPPVQVAFCNDVYRIEER